MGKKREQEERGRRKGENPKKGKKADSAGADAEQASGGAAVSAVPANLADKMIIVKCPAIPDRAISPGLSAGQAFANPKRGGHRCTVCGNLVAVGHSMVRAA